MESVTTPKKAVAVGRSPLPMREASLIRFKADVRCHKGSRRHTLYQSRIQMIESADIIEEDLHPVKQARSPEFERLNTDMTAREAWDSFTHLPMREQMRLITPVKHHKPTAGTSAGARYERVNRPALSIIRRSQACRELLVDFERRVLTAVAAKPGTPIGFTLDQEYEVYLLQGACEYLGAGISSHASAEKFYAVVTCPDEWVAPLVLLAAHLPKVFP